MKCKNCGGEIKTKSLEQDGLCEWCVNELNSEADNEMTDNEMTLLEEIDAYEKSRKNNY